jgi:hypothetical protein
VQLVAGEGVVVRERCDPDNGIGRCRGQDHRAGEHQPGTYGRLATPARRADGYSYQSSSEVFLLLRHRPSSGGVA